MTGRPAHGLSARVIRSACSDASPTDFYSVGAERGRPRTEVRHAWSQMRRQGTACTKVVLQSRVRIWRWYVVGYAVILPGRWWCRTWTFLLVSGFCSSACCLFPCLVPSSLRGRWFLAFSVRRVPSPPWEGAVLVLSVLRLFVVLVYFAVEEFFLLSSVRLVYGATWTSTISSWILYLGRFRCIFRVAGCPPGGEICRM